MVRVLTGFLAILMTALSTLSFLSAQSSIQGKVTDAETGEGLIGVNVIIEGTTQGASTDLDGNYAISGLVPGTYTITASYISYSDFILPGVEVLDGGVTTVDVPMKSVTEELGEVIVQARADRSGEAALLVDRKEATELVQKVGAKELSKKGVSTVADGVKKVVGVSTFQNKFIQVRGMGDKFNTANLNGLPLPSPDPDRKVIQLDLFPLSVVENLTITKGFRPDYFGDFAGGAVDITTKQYPDELTIKIGLGTGFNTNSTFKDFVSYKGGKTDFLGFDDGSRALSQELNDFVGSQLDEYPFDNNFNPITKKSPVNTSFDVSIGNYIRSGNKATSGWGFLISAGFDNAYLIKDRKIRQTNKQGQVRLDYDSKGYEYSTNSSLLGSLTYRFNHKHSLSFNTLFINQSSDEVRETDGSHFDYSPQLFTRRFTFRQNALWVNQMTGKHQLARGLKFDWSVAYDKISAEEPDRRQLVFTYSPSPEPVYLINNIDLNDNHHYFIESKESQIAGASKFSYTLGESSNQLTINAGFDVLRKERNFDFDRFFFGFQTEEFDINNPESVINADNFSDGRFSLNKGIDPSAQHEAVLQLLAPYSFVEWDVIPTRLKFIGGVRLETGRQRITFKNPSQPIFTEVREINSASLLPSVSLKYSLTEKANLWLLGSRTVIRPNFKEVAPFTFTEVFAGTKSRGNPILTNSFSTNIDFRYEIFPSRNELISLGAFYKNLQDLIERVNLATSSGQLQSFLNAERGNVMGLELELVKGLGFLSSVLDNFRLNLNASWMYSNVNVGESAAVEASDGKAVAVILTNSEHPLQGASPYLFNADLVYENRFKSLKLSSAVAFNIFGKRLYSLGSQGIDDAFQLPTASLNYVLKGSFDNGLGFSFSAKNLLNPEQKIVQQTDGGEVEIDAFRRGISFGLGLSFEF